MPAWSVFLPISPPRASISFTKCPFAMPPMAGLQDIWAMRSGSMVSRSVRALMRAAARAASHPAWPPPTTTTSYCSLTARVPSFPDTKFGENPFQDFIGRDHAGNFSQCIGGDAKVHGDQFACASGFNRLCCLLDAIQSPLKRLDVAEIGHQNTVLGLQPARRQAVSNRLPQEIQSNLQLR